MRGFPKVELLARPFTLGLAMPSLDLKEESFLGEPILRLPEAAESFIESC